MIQGLPATKSLPALKKRRAAEVLAGDIRNRIVRGELTPETGLPTEAQLIQDFGVSRPTMREAMSILESAGLIEVVRGARGGARVKPFTGERAAEVVGHTLQAGGIRVTDLLEARRAIEPSAARLAAERRPKDAAMELRERIIAEYEAIEDEPRFALAVGAFNRALMEAGGNQTLALFGHTVQSVVEKHFSLAKAELDRSRRSSDFKARIRAYLKAQEQLATLIASGDGDGAEAFWRAQLNDDVNYYWLAELDDPALNVLD